MGTPFRQSAEKTIWFSPHKSGSMFVFKFLKKLSELALVPLYSDNHQHPRLSHFLEDSKTPNHQMALVGPVRDLEKFKIMCEPQNSPKVKSIVQTRDPLDLAVSQYFSHGWIHTIEGWSEFDIQVRQKIQGETISIEDYVEIALFEGYPAFGAPIFQKQGERLLADPSLNNSLFVSYEDMILNYEKWSASIALHIGLAPEIIADLETIKPTYHLEDFRKVRNFWSSPAEYVAKFNIGPGAHIRSPEPGGHRYFLSPKKILEFRGLLAKKSAE